MRVHYDLKRKTIIKDRQKENALIVFQMNILQINKMINEQVYGKNKANYRIQRIDFRETGKALISS